MSQSTSDPKNYEENYGIVLVTAGSKAEAETIADALIQSKLAACVNLLPVHSIYTWNGTIQRDEEVQLIIKTNLDRFQDIEAKVQSLHSYEVPEIIAVPILYGTQTYLQWVTEQVQN
ncbi:divalent-cation tolerance protein CutA [Thermocoleostomius sinensis]|jgi:periplasmic divalent cation tolerance protein|uniref:Divalent-cation tolerance protein CutA n=1 Tax=Thermocoleostomius sinensis A174 TaxID=2016057 RepID=A0A9E8ZA18_9CYAN|nr:divalent-cation tolerance protein CutA [Thermocoleostomius sinensis]WAL59323.1 divalent-cation tolerance protein CutA [Thermocoleostomius sinensis A174]